MYIIRLLWKGCALVTFKRCTCVRWMRNSLIMHITGLALVMGLHKRLHHAQHRILIVVAPRNKLFNCDVLPMIGWPLHVLHSLLC